MANNSAPIIHHTKFSLLSLFFLVFLSLPFLFLSYASFPLHSISFQFLFVLIVLTVLKPAFPGKAKGKGRPDRSLKWMKGYNKGDINKVLVVREQGRTRSNGFKLDKFRITKDIGKNWFTNRVVDEWNRLSSHVVSGNTVDSFKRRLDKFIDGKIDGDGWCWVW